MKEWRKCRLASNQQPDFASLRAAECLEVFKGMPKAERQAHLALVNAIVEEAMDEVGLPP